MGISILSIRCRVKPATPQEVGYTCWEAIKKAMDKQSARPLAERLRPCHRHNWWWIEQEPWCTKCEDALWHLDMDGRRVVASFGALDGKEVELVVEGTGEVLRYRIGKGFVDATKKNPAAA